MRICFLRVGDSICGVDGGGKGCGVPLLESSACATADGDAPDWLALLSASSCSIRRRSRCSRRSRIMANSSFIFRGARP